MKDIIKAILDKKKVKPNTIIAIDGLGGSGKTTIVEKLAKKIVEEGYNPIVLHIDDFIHPRNIRYNDDYEQWYCYYNIQWRYEYFINEILIPLKNAEAEIERTIERYSMENDDYTLQTITYNPRKSIIIVEGIYLHRPELIGMFDYTMYLDVPKEIRLQRVIQRDTYIGNTEAIIQKYESRYFPAEERYEQQIKPQEIAGIVLNSLAK